MATKLEEANQLVEAEKPDAASKRLKGDTLHHDRDMAMATNQMHLLEFLQLWAEGHNENMQVGAGLGATATAPAVATATIFATVVTTITTTARYYCNSRIRERASV